jgi:hypothetical protein
MSQIGLIGKTAYIFDEGSNTWHPIAGMTDTSANFSWTGSHSFSQSGSVSFGAPAVASAGINNFLSINDRNAKMPNPTDGTIAIVPVNNIVQLQYFYNGSWRLFGNNAFLEERTTSNFVNTNIYNLALSDSGKTLEMNSASSHIVTIPFDTTINFPIGSQIAFIQSGAGQTEFRGAQSSTTVVNILSKNSNKKLSARYSQAILVKKSGNTWYLMGDLTA